MDNQIVHNLANSLSHMNISESLVERALTLGTEAEAIVDWIDLASDLRNADKPHASLLVYQSSEKIFPNDRYLWNNRGALFRFWERYDEAIACYKKALSIDPSYLFAKEGLADCFQRMHDFTNALNVYKELFSVTEGSPQAWNKYAQCLKETKDYEGAIFAYKKSVSLDLNYTEPIYNLAGLLNQLKLFPEALDVIEQLIFSNPDDNEAIKLRGEILKKSINPIRFEQLPIHVPRQVLRSNRNFKSLEELDKIITAGINNIPLPATLPPSAFISYRWGSVEENEWVSKFAADLTERGYDVVFDREVQSQRSEPLPVHELVALMLKCNLFLPILTERYRRRVDRGLKAYAVEEDGWVFDEYQVGLKLGKLKRLNFKGIWRSGPVVPVPFRPENVCDFRNDNNYDNEMNRAFSRCMANITGFILNGGTYTTDPIERIMVKTVGKELERTGQYNSFLISYWMA